MTNFDKIQIGKPYNLTTMSGVTYQGSFSYYLNDMHVCFVAFTADNQRMNSTVISTYRFIPTHGLNMVLGDSETDANLSIKKLDIINKPPAQTTRTPKNTSTEKTEQTPAA